MCVLGLLHVQMDKKSAVPALATATATTAVGGDKKDTKQSAETGTGAAASSGGGSSAAAKRMPYYSSDEVSRHIVFSDCWVSYFGKVYNLTPLVAQYKGM